MDFYTIVVICVVAFVIFAFCGYCCKRSGRRGAVTGPPITVTTTHVTATPIVQPPYPTDARHPLPLSVPPPVSRPMGFSDYPAGYQTAPYPPGPAAMMYSPYPAHPIAPYPPAQAPPPSYTEAVSQPVVPAPPVAEHFAKQSPYNPNY